jgi:hypothetical protein
VDVVVNIVVSIVYVVVHDLVVHVAVLVVVHLYPSGVIDARGAQHDIVVEACCANHVCMLPASTAIRLVEAICTNADT